MTALSPAQLELAMAAHGTTSKRAILLPSQLPKSMRALPNVGTVLHDRFASLQRRNLVEVHVPKSGKRGSRFIRPSVRFVERRSLRIPDEVEPEDFIAKL